MSLFFDLSGNALYVMSRPSPDFNKHFLLTIEDAGCCNKDRGGRFLKKVACVMIEPYLNDGRFAVEVIANTDQKIELVFYGMEIKKGYSHAFVETYEGDKILITFHGGQNGMRVNPKTVKEEIVEPCENVKSMLANLFNLEGEAL